jgi:hypothetical protein
VLLDVVHHGCGKQIAHRQPAPHEETHFRRRDVVLDELRYEVDVVPPTGQIVNGLVYARPCAFHDECAVAAQNVVELRRVLTGIARWWAERETYIGV